MSLKLPRAPNRCGGKPLASSKACRRPTSLSSLSESGCGGTDGLPLPPTIDDGPAVPVNGILLGTSGDDEAVGVNVAFCNFAVGFVFKDDDSLLREPSLAIAA